MQTTLSDGSLGQGVHLSVPPVPYGAAALNGNIWMLGKGSNTVTIRNSRSGDIVSKVDLLDEGVAIAAVGSRIWVSTSASKVFVFDNEGTLLGALQTAANPVKRFYCLSEKNLFTSNDGKDFVKWDTQSFTAERTFFGRTAGETITDIASASTGCHTIVAASTKTLRLWAHDNTCLAELHEGATALQVVNSVTSGGVYSPAAGGGSGDEAIEKEVNLRQDYHKDLVWAAQSGWITVFSFSSQSTTQFVREKTIPSAGVLQLQRTSVDHIASIDGEGLVTIWNWRTYAPQRSFKTVTDAKLTQGVPSADVFTVKAMETQTTFLWTVHDGRALIWSDEFCRESGGADAENTAKDLQADEIDFLKRKIKFLESVGTMYRQKAGMLFREQGTHSSTEGMSERARMAHNSRISAFNDIDQEYARALSQWNENDRNLEPLPDLSPQDVASSAGDFTEYWKQKYRDSVTELEKLRLEHENLVSMMHSGEASAMMIAGSPNSGGAGASGGAAGAGAAAKEMDVKRAHHICQIIKEKNELKEQARQLGDDVSKLRAKLREFNSPLASKGATEEDAATVRAVNEELRAEITRLKAKNEADAAMLQENQAALKHNQILKQRVKKLRNDLDACQINLSEQASNAQKDMESLLGTISDLKNKVEEAQHVAQDAEVQKAASELAAVQKQALVERYQAIAEAAERELNQRDAVERAAQSEIRTEVEMLCQSLDDRDRRLAELLKSFNETSQQLKDKTAEANEATAIVEAKDIEINALQERVDQLEDVILDRKNYGRLMGELQGRMEMLVEELRLTFTPVQFAEHVDNLESRVQSLFSLEGQLRQKDDIIAVKDDEILRLKEHIERVNEQVSKVSSVFLHLPKSVEEVELLMVEVDEYRRRLGLDQETQEMIQIRLLELQAKRKAGDKIPANLDLPVTKPGQGKSANEIQRLKDLANTLNAVAKSAAEEDKQGLVATPAPNSRNDSASPAPKANTAPTPAAPVEPAAASPAKAAPKSTPVKKWGTR